MARLKWLSPKMREQILSHIEYECEMYSTDDHEPWKTFWRETLQAAKNGFDFTGEQLAEIYRSRCNSGIIFAPWGKILKKIGDILRDANWKRADWGYAWMRPEKARGGS